MLYINADGEYPRFVGDIQAAVPGWQIGDELPDGWHFVNIVPAPEPSNDQLAVEEFPVEVGGVWSQSWSVRSMTETELARRAAPTTLREKLAVLGLNEHEIALLLLGR
jgi:hypothetical protein